MKENKMIWAFLSQVKIEENLVFMENSNNFSKN